MRMRLRSFVSRRAPRIVSAALFAVGAASCTQVRAGGGAADPNIALDAYCRIAATPGLYDWTGGALVACPGLVPAAGDGPVDGSSCVVSRVAADGTVSATMIANAQSAQALSDGRLLVWGFDNSLTLQGGNGSSRIADVAADPWLDVARGRVVFVAPAAGATDFEPGEVRRVMVHDLTSGNEVEVVADATASSPVPVPGTDAILYVSGAGDTAAVYRAQFTISSADPSMTPPDACQGGRTGDPADPSGGCTPTDTGSNFVQLTNTVGGVGQAFVPPYGRQHVFVGEGTALRLVFAAMTDTGAPDPSMQVWTLDPATGEAELLGPGSWPQHGPSGSVVARSNADTCSSVQYLAPGATP